MEFNLELWSEPVVVNPDYVFVKSPEHWDRSCHRFPCSETDRIDQWMNQMAEDKRLREQERKECTIYQGQEEQRASIRWAKSRRNASAGYEDKKVSAQSAMFIEIIGVRGEMAVCRYLGIPYHCGINTFRLADVCQDIEVRTTTYKNGHCKVRPDDNNTFKVVMAITEDLSSPIYLAGWILASDGKQYKLEDPHHVGDPFHFVPQSALHPMCELRKLYES